MNLSIWKFVLAYEHEQAVRMPLGAKLLSVANQSEAPCLWALVNPDASAVSRGLLMFGTGHSADDALPRDSNEFLPFIGTVLMQGGALVLHVFDRGELPS